MSGRDSGETEGSPEHYDITRFIQLDREFHTYIYQMSQNRELLKLLSNYYDMFRFYGNAGSDGDG